MNNPPWKKNILSWGLLGVFLTAQIAPTLHFVLVEHTPATERKTTATVEQNKSAFLYHACFFAHHFKLQGISLKTIHDGPDVQLIITHTTTNKSVSLVKMWKGHHTFLRGPPKNFSLQKNIQKHLKY